MAACPGTPGLAVGSGGGTGSHLGRFSIARFDHCSIDLTPPVEVGDILRAGEFELVAADRSTLYGTYLFLLLPVEQGGFFDMFVTGGTGRFRGVTGTIRYVSGALPTCSDPLCLDETTWQPELEGTLRLPRP